MSADNVVPDGDPVGDGFLTPSASTGSDDAMFGLPDRSAGWNVGDSPAAAPSEPSAEMTDADVAARVGVDLQATTEWLTPEVEHELTSRGLLVPEPKTDAELTANLLTADGLRAKVEDERARVAWEEAQAVASEQLAANQLLELYESGELSGSEMADYARVNLSPDAAAQVIQHWITDEEEFDEEPESAIGYVEQLAQAAREQQAQEAWAAQEAAQQAATQQQAANLAAARAELQQQLDRNPSLDLEQVRQSLSAMSPSIQTEQDAVAAVRHAAAGEAEVRRATWAANILTGFDEDRHREDGFMTHHGITSSGERWSQTFDRQAAYERNVGRALQPERAVHRERNVEAAQAKMHHDLFAEDEARAAGWNVGRS